MEGLAAYMSSDSDDDDSSSAPPVPPVPNNKTTKELSQRSKCEKKEGKVMQSQSRTSCSTAESSHKKRRREDDDDDNVTHNTPFLSQYQLPKPTLKQNVELCSWSVDNLSAAPASKGSCPDRSDGRRPLDPPEYIKFQALLSKSSVSSSSGWAAQLREQKEFHNPHFFQAVVEYFQIDDPLGSHVVDVNDHQKIG
jgi:hypothetical protein